MSKSETKRTKRDFKRASKVNIDPDRLQGWLTVANSIETESLDQLEWQKRYCVLLKDERKLYFFNDTESVLMSSPLSPARFKFTVDDLDGQSASSSRKMLDPNSPFQRGTRATRSFRDKVKSSLQKSVKRKQESFGGGGSVRVTRSKSVGKADRLDIPMLKLGSSLDNLHRVGSHGTPDTHHYNLGDHGTFLDLATRGTLSIQVVHQSVSPRHSCFRIVTEQDILYASCGSQEELHKWATNLLECQRPNRNHLRRLDTQLSLWVLEARNLQPKKRYYCEIFLNGILYAQTCCKMMNDILFWGEPFIFEDLPILGSVIIKIYRENYNKKKRERNPATDIGKIEIPALVLEGGQLYEKWFPVVVYQSTAKDRERETPSVRIKLQYQVVSILPLKVYEDFLRYLKTDYGVVCDVLEPIISAKAKDEIAQTLVRILQVGGRAKEFLCDIIMAEVQLVENENLIFRGNTFATKAVDTYMKMVGETYLRETLSEFICTLLEMEEECEVDPMKMQPGANLQHSQLVLTRLVDKAWCGILSSFNRFPSDLRNTLHGIRQRFGPEKEDACMKLISGSIFLRFFCPAILSPSLFQLCQEYPDERTSRKLTLVAKVVQNLANFTRFGVKEEYMCFMNDFVEREIKNMKQFIGRISSPVTDTDPVVEWGPANIDLGREASMMHVTLSTQLKSVHLSEAALSRVEPLIAILEQITKVGEEEEGDPFSSTYEALRIMQSTISNFNGHSSEKASDESSSEYTTPGQSQPTSPSRELSPPPPFPSVAQMALSTLLGLTQPSAEQSSSPNTSPTHGGMISSLATHSISAGKAQHGNESSSESLTSSTRTSPPTHSRHGASAEPPSPRRLSDSALQKFGVHPKASSLHPVSSHAHSRSIDATFRFDEHIEIAQLRAENAQLIEEIERLRKGLEKQRREVERENDKTKKDSAKAEEVRRKAEQDLKGLRDSRGKILRGLNTQTEIALVQFKRDFENLKRQLQAKDEIIAVQERKIASLVDANCTLRNGLQELHALPKHEDSDSDMEDDLHMHSLQSSQSSQNGKPVTNGLPGSQSTPTLNSDLMHVISQLDSGRFDVQ